VYLFSFCLTTTTTFRIIPLIFASYLSTLYTRSSEVEVKFYLYVRAVKAYVDVEVLLYSFFNFPVDGIDSQVSRFRPLSFDYELNGLQSWSGH